MTKLTRRSVLTGFATVPLVSAPLFWPRSTLAQVRHATGTRWLYVYIHGAVVIEFQPGGVRLLPPRVLDSAGNIAHEYRAGYLVNGEGTLLSPASPIALTGFMGAGTPTQIDKTAMPCLDNIPLGPTGSIYCGAVFPTPDAVVPLRQIPQASDNTPFFGAPELKDLKWLPLLLLLEYELQPNDHPALVGTGGTWKDDGRNPLILHFRAEPGSVNNADHDAIHDIEAILNKPLKLNQKCYGGARACPKNIEEQSLLELRTPSPVCTPVLPCATETKEGIGIRSRPANCVSIVVNNSGS